MFLHDICGGLLDKLKSKMPHPTSHRCTIHRKATATTFQPLSAWFLKTDSLSGLELAMEAGLTS